MTSNAMRHSIILITALAGSLVGGCNNSPGRPALNSQVVAPDKILRFDTLYQENCAGCHGAQGNGGAAIALNSPIYLAIADDATIRRVTAEGVPGTAMPAFAQSSGGMLTDDQVNAIVSGIRTRWAKRDSLDLTPPSYLPLAAGDPKRGLEVYGGYCSSCHGAAGREAGQAGSITDQSFLALVSDQYLRTIVITGRPELGAPDWRGDVPGKAMSQQDISDVVAWLSTLRPKSADQLTSSAKSSKAGIQ